MARGRMINKKISNSKRVNDLPEPAQLLFTWIIPHLDCNGCFYGSAQMIKSLVFPRKKYSIKRIENWLKLMENALDDEKIPLIIRYFADGEQYLFMPGFEGEQVGLRRDKEKPEYPHFDGKITKSIRQNVGVREGEVEVEVEIEEEENNPPIVPPLQGGTSLQDFNDEAKKIWEVVLKKIQSQVSKPNYRTWFEKTKGLNHQDSQFLVGVPNNTVAEYLGKNQCSLVEKALADVIKKPVSVSFHVIELKTNTVEGGNGQ